MTVVPRLEISFIREAGSDPFPGLGIVLRATPVQLPAHLLAPALFGTWLGLAPWLAWQAAFGTWIGSLAAAPTDQCSAGPDDVGSLPDNVLRLPTRHPG